MKESFAWSEPYSKPCQTSKIKLFVKLVTELFSQKALS